MTATPKGYLKKPNEGNYKQGKDGKWYTYQDLSVANRLFLETKFELDKLEALRTPAPKTPAKKRKAKDFSTPPVSSRTSSRLRLVSPENPKGMSEAALKEEEERVEKWNDRTKRYQPQKHNRGSTELSEADRQKLQNLPDWMQKLRDWLLNVDEVSMANCQQVMRQCEKMATGVGVTYHHWNKKGKDAIWFYRGTKIDLSFDFDELYDEAQDMENQHGRDLGNGWLLRHPLVKLKKFQQYLKEQEED